MFKFNLQYFIATVILFIVEILIATTFKNLFWLRAFGGDILVVILIYTFILSFIKYNKTKVAFGVLLFSFIIEFLQYFKIATLLGFKTGSIGHIVIGNSFSWMDILCYIVGFVAILIFDRK